MQGTYLPLDGEVTVTGGNTEEERVKVNEIVREEDGVVRSRGCVDYLQNILGEGLLDPAAKLMYAHNWLEEVD
jgi:hypothetical protein